jgi:hypothetical protein
MQRASTLGRLRLSLAAEAQHDQAIRRGEQEATLRHGILALGIFALLAGLTLGLHWLAH